MPNDSQKPRPGAAVPRVALSMTEAAHSLGVSRPAVYGLVERGLLQTFTVNRRRLVTPRALEVCVSQLEAAGSPLPQDCPSNRRATAA